MRIAALAEFQRSLLSSLYTPLYFGSSLNVILRNEEALRLTNLLLLCSSWWLHEQVN
jgi:hypothetical protein